MSCLISAATWIAAGILVHFVLRFVSSTSRRTWGGARWRWWTFSVAIPCVGGGAIGTAFGVAFAPGLLAAGAGILCLGAALFLVANQRRCIPAPRPARIDPPSTGSPAQRIKVWKLTDVH